MLSLQQPQARVSRWPSYEGHSHCDAETVPSRCRHVPIFLVGLLFSSAHSDTVYELYCLDILQKHD